MSFSLALELKNCLLRHPEDEPADLLQRVSFAAFLKTGQAPTAKEVTDALLLLGKYSPEQPRVPAGNPDGGQWTSGGGSGEGSAGDWIDTALAETCETQLYLDGLICHRLGSAACWGQAQFRYSACLRGDPIPYFPYK